MCTLFEGFVRFFLESRNSVSRRRLQNVCSFSGGHEIPRLYGTLGLMNVLRNFLLLIHCNPDRSFTSVCLPNDLLTFSNKHFLKIFDVPLCVRIPATSPSLFDHPKNITPVWVIHVVKLLCKFYQSHLVPASSRSLFPNMFIASYWIWCVFIEH